MAKQNKSSTDELQQRVLDFFHQHFHSTGTGPLLVAVSGGPDSVCLFNLLYELKDKLGINLHIVHLDHQLRGEESVRDARFVSDLARQYNLPATIEGRNVTEYRLQHHLSLEEAAREVRYTFFAETAKSMQAIAVAVGHTLDDNIETILMHIIRGTGTRGLIGLSPVTDWHPSRQGLDIIRPLLEISRQETQQYCHDHGIETRTDITNTSLDMLRNRIRLELRPMLEKYNPQINKALLKTSRIAHDEMALLDDITRQQWDIIVKKTGETIVLNKRKLLSQPTAIKRHLLRMAVAELLGNLKDIETRHIEEMLTLLNKPSGSRINLPFGLVFHIEYGRCLLGPDPAKLCPFPVLTGEIALQIPGVTLFSGWQISAQIIKVKDLETVKIPRLAKTIAIPENIAALMVHSGFKAYFDLEQLGEKIMVRPMQAGDRFQPFGQPDMKKVGRFMIDARIPRDWRKRILIVTSANQVIWVSGWRTDERYKISGQTKTILSLHLKLSN
jgi:tRNA(Ile)-lysidine synthase